MGCVRVRVCEPIGVRMWIKMTTVIFLLSKNDFVTLLLRVMQIVLHVYYLPFPKPWKNHTQTQITHTIAIVSLAKKKHTHNTKESHNIFVFFIFQKKSKLIAPFSLPSLDMITFIDFLPPIFFYLRKTWRRNMRVFVRRS